MLKESGTPGRTSSRLSVSSSCRVQQPLQFPYVSAERLKFSFLKEQPRVKTHGRVPVERAKDQKP